MISSEHVMIDLETLNNTDDSNSTLILSIAAVQFDPMTGETGLTFNKNIDIQSSLAKGLSIGGNTLKWWLNQDQEVLKSLLKDTKSLPEVLLNFNEYLIGVAFSVELAGRSPNVNDITMPMTEKLRLWGRSPRFDLGILRHAYNVCNIAPNWDGRKELDVRTIEYLNPGIKSQYDDEAKSSNSYYTHDPIKDCLHQIKYTSAILNTVKR